MDWLRPSGRQAKRLRWATLGAIMLCASLPAHAQDIGGQSSTTFADDTPAFVGGAIFNTAGNPSIGTTFGDNSAAAGAYFGGTADLAGGGTFTTWGGFSQGFCSCVTATFTAANFVITTYGIGSAGARLEEGSTMVLTGGTITTMEDGSNGVETDHFDTNRLTSSATITTQGENSVGAYLNGMGFIHLTGGSITTMKDGSHGLVAGAGGGVGEITSVIDVTTHGANAYGAFSAGSPIFLNGGTITTTGPGSHGLVANTAITSVANVTTHGPGSHGAWATAGGTITLNGGTITTGGDQAYGLYAQGAGSFITSAVNVTTNGSNAPGAYADGGTITLTGGVITTIGSPAAGLQALNGGSITSVADVATHGVGSRGVEVGNGSTVMLNGGSITTTKTGAHALFIEPTGGTITSVANISTSGITAVGALATGGTITLNGGTITTIGTNSHGLEASGTGVVNATGLTINTSGLNLGAAAMLDGGRVTIANSQLTSVQAFALASQATTGLTNTATITGSQLTSVTFRAMSFQGGTHDVTLQDSQVVGGNGQLLQVAQRVVGPDTFPTQLVLNATGSTLIGDMQILDPGTNTANVALGQGSTWSGAALDVTNLTLAGSTWNVTENSTVTDTLTNGGTIAFQWGGAFHTLNTANYVGNGGTLRMNTQLGSDTSPTDQLVITGTSTGMTGVIVTNVNKGPGAMTTGAGIPLIITQGGDGTFSGGGKAGLFQYVLFQGPGSAPGDANTWYLRSHADAPPDGGPGGPFLPPGEPVPLYRPEASIYSVMAGLARQQELTALGTFHERNGDQRLVAGAGDRGAAWGRLFGQHMEQSHWGHTASSFEGNTGGLQSGLDVAQWVDASGHQDRFGLFAAYARTTGTVRGFSLGVVNAVAGRAELDGTSVGAYWTHLAPSGWYTDAVLMGTRLDGRGEALGDEVDISGYGAVASIEGGYPIVIAPGVRLEPQAQLIYQHINLHDVDDAFSHVAYDTPDALFGRIGLRLSADLLPLPYVLRPYLKANIWQDFTETDTIRFSRIHQIVSRHEATTLELGGGIVAQLSPGVGLWASAEYTTDIGGNYESRESVRGTAGLRVVW